MTKEQFLAWAIPKYNSWLQEHPDVVPSVNRIDNKGHYEIGNIEVISWGQNATKLHLHDKSKEESRLVSLVRAKCSRYLLDINNVIKLLLEK